MWSVLLDQSRCPRRSLVMGRGLAGWCLCVSVGFVRWTVERRAEVAYYLRWKLSDYKAFLCLKAKTIPALNASSSTQPRPLQTHFMPIYRLTGYYATYADAKGYTALISIIRISAQIIARHRQERPGDVPRVTRNRARNHVMSSSVIGKYWENSVIWNRARWLADLRNSLGLIRLGN